VYRCAPVIDEAKPYDWGYAVDRSSTGPGPPEAPIRHGRRTVVAEGVEQSHEASGRAAPIELGFTNGTMDEDSSDLADTRSIQPGELVYDDDGQLVGRITGMTNQGFEVRTVEERSDSETLEEIPGKDFGEGYLMWRCTECGEMGPLDEGFPDECPNCGAAEEMLSEARED